MNKKYEYYFLDINKYSNDKRLLEEMNKLGDNEWQLMSVTNNKLIFIREKHEVQVVLS